MIHTDRKHNVIDLGHDFEELAKRLTTRTWTLDSGFRCGSLTFLNDSFSEDTAQEYAVLGTATKKQLESLTVSMTGIEELVQTIKGIVEWASVADLCQKCPKCGERIGRCPECASFVPLGSRSKCPMVLCAKMNAPIDCAGCGLVVSDALDGVLDLEQNLIPWKTI